MNICALIPSYRPDERLVTTVEDLLESGFRHVIVVDDGSGPEFQPVFSRLPPVACTVFHLPKNQGKGEALKFGFLAFLTQDWCDVGVVTVDGDGQHSARDAMRCAHALIQHPAALILGGRDLTGEQVPAKSKSGNRVMTTLLNRLCGIPIRDTQTGLRAIPRACLSTFAGLSGARYEYETNMLLYCKRHHIPMVEIPISTIYIDDNAGSHYRPVRDSLRIGAILGRWFLSYAAGPIAGLSAFFLLFWQLGRALPPEALIWPCAMAGTLVSGLISFGLTRTDSSQDQVDRKLEGVRYAVLTALQCLISGFWLTLLALLFPAIPLLAVKAGLDCLLCPCFGVLEQRIVFSRAPV